MKQWLGGIPILDCTKIETLGYHGKSREEGLEKRYTPATVHRDASNR